MSLKRLTAHVLIFAFAFSFEVRVKASEAEKSEKKEEKVEITDFASDSVQIAQAENPIEEPEHCATGKSVCAVRTDRNEKFEWKTGDAVLTLDRSSSVLRESESLARLIEGTVWVRSENSEFIVRTEFGDVKVKGEAWVTREGDRIFVSAPSTDVIVSPRGAKEDLLVEAGTQNWLSRVALKTGEAQTGLPVAIPIKEHIERWARLYPGKVQDFRIAVRSFHGRWSSAVEKAAELHKAEFDRKIASIEQEKARQAEIARKRAVEDKKLRDLFRKKVFDGL